MSSTAIAQREQDTFHQLELAANLPAGSVRITGLRLVDADLAFEDWQRLIAMIGHTQDWTRWAIGDALLFGEAVYGEEYAQAVGGSDADRMAGVLNLNVETLRNYERVCAAVAHVRRRADLSFRHHDAVYKLEPDDQERWLQRAADERWTSSQLREAVRDANRPPQLAQDDGSEVVQAEGPSRLERALELAETQVRLARPTSEGTYEIPGEVHEQWLAFLGRN